MTSHTACCSWSYAEHTAAFLYIRRNLHLSRISSFQGLLLLTTENEEFLLLGCCFLGPHSGRAHYTIIYPLHLVFKHQETFWIVLHKKSSSRFSSLWSWQKQIGPIVSTWIIDRWRSIFSPRIVAPVENLFLILWLPPFLLYRPSLPLWCLCLEPSLPLSLDTSEESPQEPLLNVLLVIAKRPVELTLLVKLKYTKFIDIQKYLFTALLKSDSCIPS